MNMQGGKKNKPTPGSSRLLTVCGLLNRAGAKYIVVGAQALALHGVIRATKDVDILIPRDRKNTAKVLQALSHLGFGIARELSADEVFDKPWTIIGDTPRVDLMTVANNVKYEEAAQTALMAQIQGIKVCYPDYRTLIKTKKTGRLQDQADIERLKAIHKIRRKT